MSNIYETLALKALGLPNIQNASKDLCLNIGTFLPSEDPSAADAIIEHKLKKIGILLSRIQLFEPLHHSLIIDQDFLNYQEFCNAIGKISHLKETYDSKVINHKIETLRLKKQILENQMNALLGKENLKKDYLKEIYESQMATIREQAYSGKTDQRREAILSRINTLKIKQNELGEHSESPQALRLQGQIEQIDRELELIESSAQFPPETIKLKRISELYRTERHTSDRAGYLRYIEDVNKPVAVFLNRGLAACLSEADRKKHTYIVAQSGAGKSELMKALVHAYLNNPAFTGTLVIIDPANDFAEEIGRFKEMAGDERVIYIDPILFPEHTPTINPFEAKDTSEETIHIMSEQLSSVFQELLRKAGYAEMTGNMKSLLIPCLSTLLRHKESNLCDLLVFMNDNLNAKLHAEGLRSPFPSHREFFRHNFYEKKYEFTKAAIASRVQSLLNSPVLYNLLVGRSTFELEKAINGGKVIIFALPKGGAGEETSSTFGSFVLGLLQGIVIKRFKSPKEDRLPIHVFVDECQNFLSSSVKTILTESRKYGLHLTLAQQYYGQDLDKDMLGAIMGNTAIKIVGQNDVYTLRKMDERLNVGVEELQKLKCGEFFIKVSGDKPAFKIYVHSHLVGNKNSVTEQEWAHFKHQQQAKYYRSIAPATTPALTGQMVSVEFGVRETKQPPKYVELI